LSLEAGTLEPTHAKKKMSIIQINNGYLQSSMHSHPYWEIGFYYSGKGKAKVGTKEIKFQKGTIICYPPKIPHKEDCEKKCTGLFIHTNHLPFKSDSFPVLQDNNNQSFYRTSQLLYEEFLQKQDGWESNLQHLFDVIITYILRWQQKDFSHPLVRKLKHLIYENFSDPFFHLAGNIDKLPISSDHLRKIFKQETGFTPNKFLIYLRIQEAKKILQTNRISIKNVCYNVGFQDPYYFSRIFFKLNGIRPSKYLKINPKIT